VRSKSFKIKVVATDTEILDDVGNDSARHIARMPCESYQTVGTKRIGIMTVAAGSAEKFAANLAQTAVKLPTIPGWIFAHRSRGEHKFVPERGRYGAPGFQQCFQMRFGGLLKTECGFATVASVSVTPRQQRRLGNPYAVGIPAQLHF
jgi:hypothetical protein